MIWNYSRLRHSSQFYVFSSIFFISQIKNVDVDDIIEFYAGEKHFYYSMNFTHIWNDWKSRGFSGNVRYTVFSDFCESAINYLIKHKAVSNEMFEWTWRNE